VALGTFAFQRGKKAFHQRSVVGFPFPAHTPDNPIAFQERAIGATGLLTAILTAILTAAVRVMHQAGV
jgi:hypothetical protein